MTEEQPDRIGKAFSEAELEEALGAYALDAIDDPGELAAIERHIASSPRARSEVDAYRHVAAAMGNAATDAPADLWTRIASNLPPAASTPMFSDPPKTTVVSLAEKRSRSARPWVGAAAAAASFAVVASGFAVNRTAALSKERKRNQANEKLVSEFETQKQQLLSNIALEKNRFTQLNQQLDDLRSTPPLKLRLAQLETAPNVRRVPLKTADGKLVGHILLTAEGEGYIIGDTIPTLASGRTYQLWGVKGKEVLSLGVMGRSPKAMPFAGDEQWQALVLTDEASPGVVQSKAGVAAIADLDQA